MSKSQPRPLWENSCRRAKADTCAAIHTSQFWAAEVLGLTAAGSYAAYLQDAREWSPIETAFFSFLIIIGGALAILLLTFGGAWVLAWPRRLREARTEAQAHRTGYLAIELDGMKWSVANRSQPNIGNEDFVWGAVLSITNDSSDTPLSVVKVSAVSVKDRKVNQILSRIDEYHPSPIPLDAGALLKGREFDDSLYLQPHQNGKGVVNFLERHSTKESDIFLFVEDSRGHIYQGHLNARRYRRKLVKVDRFPWD